MSKAVGKAGKSAPVSADDLHDRIARSRHLLATGNRDSALGVAREAVGIYPSSALAQRTFSYSLTYHENFFHDARLCRRLVEDGSIAAALDAARKAMRLPDANYEDFLQAGYCLTALGAFQEGTELIRQATDMFSQAEQPSLFATMDKSWKAIAPSFLVIGVAKGGTTSLHHFISCHSRVLAPVTKEVNYFGAPERGLDWYLAHFPRRPAGEKRFITGESRVGNFDNWLAPNLIKQTLPGVKLIAVLRDPVERALSHYYNDKRAGTETRTLERAIDEELAILDCPDDQLELNLRKYWNNQRNYLSLGLYALHLEHWLSVFSPDEVLIVISEEFHAAPDVQMKRVFKHLGLEYEAQDEYRNRHSGTYDQQSRDKTRARLIRFFERHNERLYELLNRRLDWQSAGAVPTAKPVHDASTARILQLKGEWGEAAHLWKKCLSKQAANPNRPAWLRAAGEAFLRSGNLQEAEETFTVLSQSEPQSPAGPVGLAKLAQARGKWAEARSRWEDCLARYAGHPEKTAWMQSYVQVLVELGAWEAAERVCSDLISAAPDLAAGYSGLARAAQMRGDNERAAVLWDDCLRRFPEHAERAWWLGAYGNMLLNTGKFQRAEEVLGELARLDPQTATALPLLARLARQKGELKRSAELMGECIERFPDHPDQQWWLPFYADILLDMQSPKLAREIYSRSIAAFPDNPGPYGGLARASQQLGDAAGTAAILEKGIERFPASQERNWWLTLYGHALCDIGKLDRAELVFREVARLHPNESAGSSGLARIAAQRGDWPTAIRHLMDCTTRFPQHPDMSWWVPMLKSCQDSERASRAR